MRQLNFQASKTKLILTIQCLSTCKMCLHPFHQFLAHCLAQGKMYRPQSTRCHRLAVIGSSHRDGGSGLLSESLSSESSALDKLEPPKAVTAPQYHLYVHLAPVRMLLTFYKSQKHVKSTWQSHKNLSKMAGLLWLSESTDRASRHPSNHNRENVITMQNWEKGGPVIGCILFISVRASCIFAIE